MGACCSKPRPWIVYHTPVEGVTKPATYMYFDKAFVTRAGAREWVSNNAKTWFTYTIIYTGRTYDIVEWDGVKWARPLAIV